MFLPHLEVLDLRENPAIGDIVLGAVVRSLDKCPLLRELELARSKLDDAVDEDTYYGRIPEAIRSPGDTIMSEATAQEPRSRWRKRHWKRLTHLSLKLGWCQEDDSSFLNDVILAAKTKALGTYLTHLTITCPTTLLALEDLTQALMAHRGGLRVVWPNLEKIEFVALMSDDGLATTTTHSKECLAAFEQCMQQRLSERKLPRSSGYRPNDDEVGWWEDKGRKERHAAE